MTNEECNQLYERLILNLQRLGLDWVVELSRQEISVGKLIKQREEYRTLSESSTRDTDEIQRGIPTIREDSSIGSGSARAPGRGQTSLMTVEYTPTEKLKILLAFIKQAVVDTTLLEGKVLEYFGNRERFNRETLEITFTDGENDSSSHALRQENLQRRESSARRLKDLLEELLQGIDDDSQG